MRRRRGPGRCAPVFSLKAEKTVARRRPGTCEFDFGDVVIRINGEFQEELRECSRGDWRSEHFMILRKPGVAMFIATRGRGNLIAKGGLLGLIMQLPPKLVQKLNALSPRLRAACPRRLRQHVAVLGGRNIAPRRAVRGADAAAGQNRNAPRGVERARSGEHLRRLLRNCRRAEPTALRSKFDCRCACMLAVLLYERIGGMLTCGVEVSDPRIFGRGSIAARCEPGACRFYLDGAVAVIHSEAARGRLQEEIKTVRRDSCSEVRPAASQSRGGSASSRSPAIRAATA